jgi:phytoene synthase
VRRFHLGKADFHAVIEGMMMDVEQDVRWPPEAVLDLYCDRVASAVGRLSVRVFGIESATGTEIAHHLGRALQLTNILRDIDEDAAIGRVYLPLEPLMAAGVSITVPLEVVADPRIEVACQVMAAKARDHFRRAQTMLAERPRGHIIAPRLMTAVYARLLTRLENIGWKPPRKRVRTSKIALLWTIACEVLAH